MAPRRSPRLVKDNRGGLSLPQGVLPVGSRFEKPQECHVCCVEASTNLISLHPCGHWLCENCVVQTGHEDVMKCPFCRSEVQLPERIKALRAERLLNNPNVSQVPPPPQTRRRAHLFRYYSGDMRIRFERLAAYEIQTKFLKVFQLVRDVMFMNMCLSNTRVEGQPIEVLRMMKSLAYWLDRVARMQHVAANIRRRDTTVQNTVQSQENQGDSATASVASFVSPLSPPVESTRVQTSGLVGYAQSAAQTVPQEDQTEANVLLNRCNRRSSVGAGALHTIRIASERLWNGGGFVEVPLSDRMFRAKLREVLKDELNSVFFFSLLARAIPPLYESISYQDIVHFYQSYRDFEMYVSFVPHERDVRDDECVIDVILY
jgi:hypothetical protein